MKLREPFILNNKQFSTEALLEFAGAKADSPGTPDWETALYQFFLDLFDDEKPLIQQTSGTTGEPKSIPLSRDAMHISAKRTLDHFGLQPGDTALLCLPIKYIAGKMMVVRALLGGLNLVTVEPTGKLGDWVTRRTDDGVTRRPDDEVTGRPGDGVTGRPGDGVTKIDFAAMVPLQVYEMLKTPAAFSRIGTLIIGGGEIDPMLRKKIRALDGIEIYETFAMSETYTHFAIRRLNGPGSEHVAPGMRSSRNSREDPFQIMEGVQVDLDERGCLVVDIPGVTDGPVVSNDLAEFTGPRSFRWLGRLDHVIKTGGIKVIPETIETVVKELSGREAVIVPVPDRRLGQKLLLVLEGEDGAGESAMLTALKARLAPHEIPKEIRTLPEFPRNSSMKIDRIEIRRMLGVK